MSDSNNNISEITLWLVPILKKQDFKEWTVDLEGNSSKGDGYACDIVFVRARGVTSDGLTKELNFALKCAKRNKVLSSTIPMQEIVENELYMYRTIFQLFKAFEEEKGIKNPFNSTATFYGQHVNDCTQVAILENLKKNGYDLWKQKVPWTRLNLEFAVKEYGKFHALSVAVQDQKPEFFKEMSRPLFKNMKKVYQDCGMLDTYEKLIEDAYEVLQDELESQVLDQWRLVKKIIHSRYADMYDEVGDLKVILHGDCWNNNFLLKLDTNNVATRIAMLDFQTSRLSSPILDLSYFLFSCVSKEDVLHIDEILNDYYDSLANHLKLLGSDPAALYPRRQFLEDWKTFSIFGVISALLPIKVAYVDTNDIPDVAQAADEGKNLGEIFLVEVKDKAAQRDRLKEIVKYAVKNCVI